MEAKIANDALIPVWVLAENVLDNNHYFLDYILCGNLSPYEFLKSQDTSFSCLLDFDGNYTHSRDSFACKCYIDLLGIVFELI